MAVCQFITSHWETASLLIKIIIAVIGLISAIVAAILGVPKMYTFIMDIRANSNTKKIQEEMDKNRQQRGFQNGLLNDIAAFKKLSKIMQSMCILRLKNLDEIRPGPFNSYIYSTSKYNNNNLRHDDNPFGRY